MVQAGVAEGFVPLARSLHMQRCNESKRTQNRIKVQIRGAKNSYSKTNQTYRH